MPVPSLFQLAQKKAMRNIRAIQDVGLVPYNLLKPILAKVDKAEHLRSLELKSPHIQEDNAELWINFIKRDIPEWDQIELPTNPDCWYDVYRELMERAQEQLDRDAQKMKAALEGINSDRAKNTARFVDPHTLRTLPKERPTQKQRYAAHDRRMGGLTPVFADPGGYKSGGGGSGFGNMDGPVNTFETPRLPRGTSGRSSSGSPSGLFAPVKRQKALNVPTHQLTNRATPIRQAPRAFVNDHKISKVARPPPQASSRVPRGRVIAPGRQKALTGSANPAVDAALQEREARLRNLMSSKPKPVPAPSAISPRQRASTASTNSPPSTITLPGCSPSTAPRRIKRVQASPPNFTSPVPKPVTTRPMDTNLSPSKSTATNNSANSKPSSAPPMIRKRPPPSVLMQPKKRKIV